MKIRYTDYDNDDLENFQPVRKVRKQPENPIGISQKERDLQIFNARKNKNNQE